MLTHARFREIVEFCKRARYHGDDDSADRAFVGLLSQLIAHPLPDVNFATEFRARPLEDPHEQILRITDGMWKLEMARPRLALEVYGAVVWSGAPSLTKTSRPRQGVKASLADELATLGLEVPDGWLIPEAAPREAWMTAEEIAIADGK